jgi:hypothetical protein
MDFFHRARLVWLLAGLVLALLAVACEAPDWETDPDVQAARVACAGLKKAEHFGCVEREAVGSLNPDVCRLAGIALDDACLQAVYEAAGDPTICDRIYLKSVVPDCRAWYAQ